MTVAHFDALASSTPRRLAASSNPRKVEAAARRIVRIVWLTARLVRREPVSLARCHERFGLSLRTFHRDIASLRDAGICIDARTPGEYRMVCFRPEREAA